MTRSSVTRWKYILLVYLFAVDSFGSSQTLGDDELGPPISADEFAQAMADPTLLAPPPEKFAYAIENSGQFQGDIKLTPEQKAHMEKGDRSATLGVIWDNGVMPYTIGSEFTDRDRLKIARAMAEYQDTTCIRFVGRTHENDYIHIISENGCWSSIGRIGGKQKLSLNRRGCVSFGIIIHEFMHAAGFHHEQSRYDRDKYVRINWNNMRGDYRTRINFMKESMSTSTNLGLGYDYGSIMHYGKYAFSINGRPTITPVKPGVTFGQRNGFSHLDVTGLKLLYNCSGSDCLDKHESCQPLADAGGCQNFPELMLLYCPKACGKCDTTCRDISPNCPANLHQCLTNIDVQQRCRKSCGLCVVMEQEPTLSLMPSGNLARALGTSVYVICAVNVEDPALIKEFRWWGPNGEEIPNSDKSIITLNNTAQPGNLELYVHKLKKEDVGTYKCTAIYEGKFLLAEITIDSYTCGLANRGKTRIFGGEEAEVNEYPWMVGILESSFSSHPKCGGSIINEKFVLTAAHCVDQSTGGSPTEVVVVGEHRWSTSSESTVTEDVSVAEIIIHADYTDAINGRDIALLKLSKPLTFGHDNKVAPICHPEPGNLYSDTNAIITGWGLTSFTPPTVSDDLLEATVRTMSNSNCQHMYGGSEPLANDIITDDMLCAGLPEGGKDTCKGDSGGPIIIKDSSIHRQIGVVSWGAGCAEAGRPGVYTRVTSHLNWINYHMGGDTWYYPSSSSEPHVTHSDCGVGPDHSPASTCPSGYTEVESQCLAFRKDMQLSWDDARVECQRTGGRLVKLKNNELLANYIKDNYENLYFWIGASDVHKEGNVGEPCMLWISITKLSIKHDCSQSKYFICETDKKE